MLPEAPRRRIPSCARELFQNPLGRGLVPETGKDARAGPREPPPAMARKPLEVLADCGVPGCHDRFQVVPQEPEGTCVRRKVFHFKGFRITGQFGRCEDLGGGHRHRGTRTRYQAGGRSRGVRRSPTPSTQALRPKTKKGHVGAEPRPISCSRGRASPVPQRRLSTRSVVAASELPPPTPRRAAGACRPRCRRRAPSASRP